VASIAVVELVAGLVAGAPSAVASVGDLVISFQLPGAKDLMVQLFGTNDKLVLGSAIVAGAMAMGAAVGHLARTRWALGVLGACLVGAVALGAALHQPLTPPLLAVHTIVVAVATGLAVLRLLLIATRPRRSRSGTPRTPGPTAAVTGGRPPAVPVSPPAIGLVADDSRRVNPRAPLGLP
jgi:hypothetical protein